MSIYYLYIKTHKKTGLKYLGQTKQDPFTYRGSGKRWNNHLKKHGNDVQTEIIFESSDKEQIAVMGIYYSNLWNVVEDKNWANIIPENGKGGDTISNHPNREKICLKNSIKAQERNAKQLAEGTHPFIKNNPSLRRVKEGTHNFLGGKIQSNLNRKLVESGTHNFLDKEDAKRRAEKLISEGRHGSQIYYKCQHCNKEGHGNSMKRWHLDNCKKRQ